MRYASGRRHPSWSVTVLLPVPATSGKAATIAGMGVVMCGLQGIGGVHHGRGQLGFRVTTITEVMATTSIAGTGASKSASILRRAAWWTGGHLQWGLSIRSSNPSSQNGPVKKATILRAIPALNFRSSQIVGRALSLAANKLPRLKHERALPTEPQLIYRDEQRVLRIRLCEAAKMLAFARVEVGGLDDTLWSVEDRVV